jgi:hypothetical protein
MFKHSVSSGAVKPEDKMLLLRECLEGPARQAVKELFFEITEESYVRALSILQQRFGEDFLVSQALKDKLDGWPIVKGKDYAALRDYADFLSQCEALSKTRKGLKILNDQSQIIQIVGKLPDALSLSWGCKVTDYESDKKEYPPFSELVRFMNRQAEILRNANLKPYVRKFDGGGGGGRNPNSKVLSTQTRDSVEGESDVNHDAKVFSVDSHETCLKCGKSHSVLTCAEFRELSDIDKKEFIRKRGVCARCLLSSHFAKGCRANPKCEKCGKRHYTALHGVILKRDERQQNSERSGNDIDNTGDQGETDVKSNSTNSSSQLYSLYVPVRISSRLCPENEIEIIAMLDVQSDSSFVLESTADGLHAPYQRASINLTTLTSSREKVQCKKYEDLQIRAKNSDEYISLSEVFSRSRICDSVEQIPTRKLIESLPKLRRLAPFFEEKPSAPIALLIGANVIEALKPIEVVDGGPGLYAQRTKLGWGLVGSATNPETKVEAMKSHASTTKAYKITTNNPDERLLKLLERDFVCTDDALVSQEDQRFLQVMRDEIMVNSEGHYQMPLPFKGEDPKLPNNISKAYHRLKSLKVRFIKDPDHFKLYSEFMMKMLKLKDAEIVPEGEKDKEDSWYIPHHGVYNPSKPGKIRVVFDCAAAYQGTSLNDHLLSGPDFMNSLPGVLCRFRLYPVAVMCDVERMFHMFHVAPRHRDYLRFLWWPNNDLNAQPVPHRMRCHLFGATSSPSCSNFALRQLAEDHRDLSCEASNFIQNDFYVDDGLHSVQTETKAIQLLKDAREICQKGSLRLHKIASNSQLVIDAFPVSEVISSKDVEKSVNNDLSFVEKALGIHWNLKEDALTFTFDVKDKSPTKRNVLSMVASVFDPLGLVAAAVLPGRLVLQEAMRSKVEWDELIPTDQIATWTRWINDMQKLSTMKIPRCYFNTRSLPWSTAELHHFADASVKGYGECSYLRVVDSNNNVHSSLVMAKSRVAPLRSVTIPRLELQAAVLAVRMARFLQNELKIESIGHYFWTDSKVVLGYIYNESKRFHTFVANRVQQILEFSKASQWHHVPSKQNPADLASRGISVDELQSSSWYVGPEMLRETPICYQEPRVSVSEDDREVKVQSVTASAGDELKDVEHLLGNFSSWSKLQAFIKLCHKWMQRSQTHSGKNPKLISSGTLCRDLFGPIQRVQNVHFPMWDRGTHLELKKLDVFKDESGILRIGGRLRNSVENIQLKHPIVLPAGSRLATLLAFHLHIKEGHQGRTTTMSALRTAGFWVCGARKIVSSVIKGCVLCARLRGTPATQKMSDLPSERCEAAPPFTNVGLDCFGPFSVASGRVEVKRWGLIFTCMASRAVHLEVLSDMTTDAFLCALRRLIALRGNVRSIRCDRGTNLVGAERELRSAKSNIQRDEVVKDMSKRNCEFVFNPPSASHFGGTWERMIRKTREVLNGLLIQCKIRLTPEMLSTLFYEVAAIINNRPLCVDTLEDPSAPFPLTPNHLLTIKPDPIYPCPGDFTDADGYSSKRWKRVQYLVGQFWARWRTEYLASLQPRRKWFTAKDAVRVGMLVVLMDENLARGLWKTGKIVALHQGSDGLVRSVDLMVASPQSGRRDVRIVRPSLLERPIHKLIPLPI